MPSFEAKTILRALLPFALLAGTLACGSSTPRSEKLSAQLAAAEAQLSSDEKAFDDYMQTLPPECARVTTDYLAGHSFGDLREYPNGPLIILATAAACGSDHETAVPDARNLYDNHIPDDLATVERLGGQLPAHG